MRGLSRLYMFRVSGPSASCSSLACRCLSHGVSDTPVAPPRQVALGRAGSVGMDCQALDSDRPSRPREHRGGPDARLRGDDRPAGEDRLRSRPTAIGQLEPSPSRYDIDTVFDLASLTKPVATATSVMILVERGSSAWTTPWPSYLPEFGQNGKEEITVFDLLTHQGGLIPDNSLADYGRRPRRRPGSGSSPSPSALAPASEFIYTDVGFLVLGRVRPTGLGQERPRVLPRHIFQPLGMTETGYLPDEPLRRRAAPTEQRRTADWMRGEVHDPRAYLLGGVAGHAGLFSTAADLAVYAQMMLDGQGPAEYQRRANPRAHAPVDAMMTPQHASSSGSPGLGWDMRTGYSSNRGESFSSGPSATAASPARPCGSTPSWICS